MEHILERVEDALGALVRLADKHEGLIPSILDLDGTQMLQGMPPAIEGQRDGDRSFRGSNTIHDEATLVPLYALAIVTSCEIHHLRVAPSMITCGQRRSGFGKTPAVQSILRSGLCRRSTVSLDPGRTNH